MKKLLTNGQMRAADARTIAAGTSGETLMARAGKALADETEAVYRGTGADSVLFVCGTGNNGGDGYVAAEILRSRGLAVEVFALEGDLSEDCARERSRYAGGYRGAIGSDEQMIVDCLFGTGLSRPVEGEAAAAIRAINASGAYVISCDIPSGLDGDNGLICGTAVVANKTVAIAALKVGFFLNDGMDCCGEIALKDIGIETPEYRAVLWEDEDARSFFPPRLRNTHKGTYGACDVIAGRRFPGAAAMCLSAALETGCGYVKLLSSEKLRDSLVAGYPQAVYHEGFDFSCEAVAFGPGEGADRAVRKTLKRLLSSYRGKLVIDADGINCLASAGTGMLDNACCEEVLLTPHLREFSRLSGLKDDEIRADPVGAAETFAGRHDAVVLLKGASAVITNGERTVVCARGDTALAKGGSGDMLTGLIAGYAARGMDLFCSAVCAHYVLGCAAEAASADLTPYCARSSDIIERIPSVVKRISASAVR